MEHNEVDITFTVKASEAQGRTLVKNVDTGETHWEPGEAVAQPKKAAAPRRTSGPSRQD